MKFVACAFAAGILMCISCGRGEDRVAAAFSAKRDILLAKCAKVGLASLPSRIYIRAFKEERTLEVWGYLPSAKRYVLVETYPIAAMSGKLGPKRKEGDGQVPEGLYIIDVFNPRSNFLLSLRVSYPNASDRVFSDPKTPGGDIYIHGNKVSIGCLAMTDDKIQEIYVLAHNAKASTIPVHIFPARLTKAKLAKLIQEHPSHAKLWNQLEPAYSRFEKSHLIPKATIRRDGSYVVAP